MTGREADHAADAGFGFSDQESHVLLIKMATRNVGFEGCEVVLEDERGRILGIAHTAGTSVARAKIALRIVGGLRRNGLLGHFSLPWARSAMGRDQHPFAC